MGCDPIKQNTSNTQKSGIKKSFESRKQSWFSIKVITSVQKSRRAYIKPDNPVKYKSKQTQMKSRYFVTILINIQFVLKS